MNPILYIGIWFVFIIAWLLYQKRKARLAVKYNPFALTTMFSRCECQECKGQFDKPFERFEYANKEIEWACVDCKKITKCLILGSFTIRIKTPKEKKWEKEFEKFQ